MKPNSLTLVVQNGLMAALYVALTFGFSFISYGMIQFRVSELLLLIVFFRKDLSVGLLVGTFLANFIGPYNLNDAIVGTMASGLSLVAMMTTHRLWLAGLYPTFINAFLIGWLLSWTNQTPYWINVLWVGLGQFVVLTLVGLPFMNLLLSHPWMKKWLGNPS